MAREKKLEVGAINVSVQPHPDGVYTDLLKSAHRQNSPVHITGDQYALLVGLRKVDSQQGNIGPLTGDIFRFTDINKNKNWFNSITNSFAEDSDIKSLNIPPHMFPNSSRFSYIFFPDTHLFFYEGYYDGNTLGATHAEKFITELFNQAVLVDKFGKVDVTHVPIKETVAEALKLYKKERIDILITRPNPDDQPDAEREVLKRMNALNVEKFQQNFTAVSGQSIELDADLNTLANVAAKNGELSIKGKDKEHRPITYSTKNHPWRLKEYYDPAVSSAFLLFVDIAGKMKQEIKNWFDI